MLKRAAPILTTVFVLFIGALVALSFAPESVKAKGLKLISRDLYFRNLGCATCSGSAPTDSVYTLRGSGIVSSAENADTTAWFSTQEWTLPGPYGPATTAANDTITWLRVTVTPEGTSPTVAADTLGVIMQVSDDEGTTATSVVWTGPAIDPDVASMGQAAILETGTTNGFKFTLKQNTLVASGGPFFSTNSAPLATQVYGYRNIRFIFTGDHTGKYRVRLTGFSNDE